MAEKAKTDIAAEPKGDFCENPRNFEIWWNVGHGVQEKMDNAFCLSVSHNQARPNVLLVHTLLIGNDSCLDTQVYSLGWYKSEVLPCNSITQNWTYII